MGECKALAKKRTYENYKDLQSFFVTLLKCLNEFISFELLFISVLQNMSFSVIIQHTPTTLINRVSKF